MFKIFSDLRIILLQQSVAISTSDEDSTHDFLPCSYNQVPRDSRRAGDGLSPSFRLNRGFRKSNELGISAARSRESAADCRIVPATVEESTESIGSI